MMVKNSCTTSGVRRVINSDIPSHFDSLKKGQRIALIVIMTALDRYYHYYIQYQPRIIVTVQYHENKETLFLTYIDRGQKSHLNL
jgi:hypothetical protein